MRTSATRGNAAPAPSNAAFRIGAVDDAAEREADAMADRALSGILRRSCATCREEDRLSRRADTHAVASDAGAAVQAALAQQGAPLGQTDATYFGSRMGANLDSVQIHQGPLAARATRAVGARAFALGNHLVFGHGEYRPREPSGRRLLAHELAHVAQATASPMLRRDPLRICTGMRIILPGTIIFEGTGGPITADIETDINAKGAPYEVHYDSAVGELVVEPWKNNDIIMDISMMARPQNEIEIYWDYLDSIDGQSVPLDVTEGNAATETASLPQDRTTWSFTAEPITAQELLDRFGVDDRAVTEGAIFPVQEAAASAVVPSLFGASLFIPTPMSMVPANSTGIMWTQGHLSLFANPGGDALIRGYRANLGWYVGEELSSTLRIRPAREFFTEKLLRGVPGGMRNDAVFPLMGGQQAVIYVTRTANEAELFAERLATTEHGGDYRYSPPRPDARAGSTEGRMAERLGTATPEAVFCTNNCVTVPHAEIEAAIGGRPRLTLPDGTIIDLTTGINEKTGGTDPFRSGRASDMAEWSQRGALPEGAQRIVYTPRAANAVGVIRVGGGLLLVYGFYRTSARLSEAYDAGPREFRRAVAEESGAWTWGIVGSALGSGLAVGLASAEVGAGGGLICSPSGPVTLGCVAVGALGGLVGGFVLGTAGALIHGKIAEAAE